MMHAHDASTCHKRAGAAYRPCPPADDRRGAGDREPNPVSEDHTAPVIAPSRARLVGETPTGPAQLTSSAWASSGSGSVPGPAFGRRNPTCPMMVARSAIPARQSHARWPKCS